MKILLAFLVISLAVALWWFAEVLELPPWAPAAGAIAAIAFLIGIVAVALLQRRQRRIDDQRRQVERSPLHQTLANLRGRCEHAVQTLREHQADHLPWVLLVGPTGAGKTAALRSSGVPFRPGLGPERFIVSGDVAATENVQFLASDRTVFVDTAGRYLCDAADHDDRREWLELLALLRAQRPGHPLAGVVLTVPAGSLAAMTVEEAGQLGVGLRRRLEDIQREFAACVPVYLLITRIDEVAGLMRVLADDPSDRLGIKVELSGTGASSAKRVAEGPLGELGLALERRAFARLEHVAAPEERGELYRAPGHFRRLTTHATAVLEKLFPDHGSAEAPIWRGLYFATAGRAATGLAQLTSDPELQSLARDYGDPPLLGDAMPASLARPAFLHGLFGSELPDDGWIAAWTRLRRGRRQARHALQVALFAGAAAVWLSLALGAVRGNLDLLAGVQEAADALAADTGEAATSKAIAPARLRSIQTVAQTLREHREYGAPWSLRTGLYQGGELVDATTRAYFTRAHDRLIVPMVEDARARLARLLAQHKDGTSAVAPEVYWRAVDDLHLYLLLTRPSVGKLSLQVTDQRRWAENHLARAWSEVLDLPESERSEADAVIRDYLVELADRPDDLVERDELLVNGMRQILGRTSRGQLWADELSTTTIAGAAPISLSSVSSAAWLTSKEDLRVEAAYTKPGWDYVRKQIRCPGRPEQRYLAAGLVIDQNDCPTERAALQAQYFERYIKAWKRFLSDIYVREPEGYKEIEAQIVDMVTPGGPGVNALESLFGAVARNARLPLPADDTTEPPADLIGGNIYRWRRQFLEKGIDLRGPEAQGELPTVVNVQQAFEPFYSYGSSPGGAAAASPTPLTAYIQLLSKIPPSLGKYTKEGNQEGLTQARTVAVQIYELVENEHLAQRDRHWTPTLEGILIPPVRGLLDAVNRDALDELTRQWCNDIVYPFDEMRDCYPFSKEATCDVSGDEVANLFQPQSGKLWQLYVDKLQSRFPFQGDRYVPASQGYNSRVKLNPAVATFLTNARELSEVVFPGGAAAPSFAFAVQFKPLASASRITLQVDGVTVSYNNSDRDRFQAMTWPGTGGAPGAHLEAHIQGGNTDLDGAGYWGLFRLLEQGDVQRSGRLIVAKLRFHDVKQDAELRLDPQNGAGNPLFGKVRGQPEPGAAPEVGLMGIFRANRLSPPRQLFTTGSSCRPPNVPSPAPTP